TPSRCASKLSNVDAFNAAGCCCARYNGYAKIASAADKTKSAITKSIWLALLARFHKRSDARLAQHTRAFAHALFLRIGEHRNQRRNQKQKTADPYERDERIHERAKTDRLKIIRPALHDHIQVAAKEGRIVPNRGVARLLLLALKK